MMQQKSLQTHATCLIIGWKLLNSKLFCYIEADTKSWDERRFVLLTDDSWLCITIQYCGARNQE